MISCTRIFQIPIFWYYMLLAVPLEIYEILRVLLTAFLVKYHVKSAFLTFLSMLCWSEACRRIWDPSVNISEFFQVEFLTTVDTLISNTSPHITGINLIIVISLFLYKITIQQKTRFKTLHYIQCVLIISASTPALHSFVILTV
jgi:hypothetical protein